MTLITTSEALMGELKTNLNKLFELSDGGAISWMLGIEIQFDAATRSLLLSQRTYLRSILARIGLTDVRPLSVPANPHVFLLTDMSPATPQDAEAMRSVPYREALGALMYAAIATRPDIMYAVAQLARYQDNPGPAHWTAVKRVYAYLADTLDFRLTYGFGERGIFGYCDADGHSTEGRHAISGYAFLVDGGAISWSSKRQELVTLSTTKAEYVAQTHAAKEAIWLRSLNSKIFGPAPKPFPLLSDNQGAIALACDNRFHARTKHIDIQYHFIREAVEAGKIDISYVASADNISDILTKALPAVQFKSLASSLGLRKT
jgi:hypothetical protein